MRIGLLTLPFNNNYGGFLQAYALMTVLKQMGHDVELINRRANKPAIKQRVIYSLKTIVKILLRMPHGALIMNHERDLKIQGCNMISFVEKYITPKTKPFYSTMQMKKECEGRYDIVVVGSDQIWRPIYVSQIEDFFLEFITDPHVKKISYAASFGTATPEYTDVEIQRCKKLIADFAAVSVREKSGLDTIKNFGWKTQIPPQVVLDPTFLLSKENYDDIVSIKKSSVPKKRICCYVLDDSSIVDDIIRKIESNLNLPSFNIIDDKKDNSPKPSIEDWLDNIKNSSFVMTDSFHGMVFSIIFNTPFAVFINRSRGADRFDSLLSQLGIEGRTCANVEDVEHVMSTPINWAKVNQKLSSLIEYSKMFLENSIKQVL